MCLFINNNTTDDSWNAPATYKESILKKNIDRGQKYNEYGLKIVPERDVSDPLDKENYSPVVSLGFHALLYGVSSLFERCLATLMGLQTLEHGTDFYSYLSITATGADPSLGGTGSSSSPILAKNLKDEYQEACKGYFHLVRDLGIRAEIPAIGLPFTSALKFFTAKMYAGIAGTARFKQIPVISHLIGLVHFLACPILRFHYTKEETNEILVSDADSAPIGAKTPHALPSHRLGMLGVLKHGSFSGICSRFYNRPLMMTACVVGLVAGAALTAVGLGFVT